MKQWVHFIFIIFCLASCTQYSGNSQKLIETENQGSGDIEKQKEIIKQTLIEMWDAIEKEDISRYASYVHPDFTQFGENDSILRAGKSDEIQGVKNWVANADNIHTEMDEPRVTINGNTAWITYYCRDQGMSEGQLFASRGKSTRIFVKEDGRWLCIHGHYTLLPDIQE